jgi:hypothetical protein
MKHTSGTWHTNDGQIYTEETGKTLALIPYWDSENDEKQANAKLIATAPMLLRALKYLICSYKADFKQITGAELNNTEAVRMAESVIQDATL